MNRSTLSPDELKMQEAMAKAQREQELSDICHVMSTVQGRRFVWRILASGRIFHFCFTGNSETFYNEGIRESHLGYYNDVMEACPDKFWLAQKENYKPKHERRRTDGRRK